MVEDRHTNAFVGMVLRAFAEHQALELEPGHLWLLVLQGLAHHVAANSEAVRHNFVNHEGKKELIVHADDFVLGSRHNDWPRVFGDFVSQIDEHTKAGVVPRMEPAFSTTTPLEVLAGRVAIMDVCQSFFSYTCMTKCGFPRITLKGTRADWQALHDRVEPLLALCEPAFAAMWRPALHSVTSRFLLVRKSPM